MWGELKFSEEAGVSDLRSQWTGLAWPAGAGFGKGEVETTFCPAVPILGVLWMPGVRGLCMILTPSLLCNAHALDDWVILFY